MSGPRASITLLRFCAGSMYFGIAAEDVVGVAPARDDAPHIGTLLGIEPARAERRMIRLAPPAAQADLPWISFQADGPVDVIRCNADDILPMPRGIPRERWKPVLGFAQMDHQLVLLLDIPSVVEKLMDYYQGVPS